MDPENKKIDQENQAIEPQEQAENQTVEAELITEPEPKEEAVEQDDLQDSATKKTGFFGKKDKSGKKNAEMQEQLDKALAEKAELQEKFLRLYSEFDNYRKRTQKEKLDVIKNASENLILNLLPMIDDLERALTYNQKNEVEKEAIVEGEQLILNKVLGILKQKGLSEINTENVKFDTDFHEAVSIVPTENPEEKGTILETVQKGYLLNEKVIRFAKVVIYQ